MKQHLAVPGSVVLLGLMLTCYNPASVDVPDPLCSGLHPKKISVICHGAHFLNPAGYCDEANCHGSDLKGGNTVGPSCYSCHGPYWEVLSQHNVSIFGKKHYKLVCSSLNFVTDCGSTYCHGASLTGTNGYMKSPSCKNCHGDKLNVPIADGSADNCDIPPHTRSMDGHLHGSTVCSEVGSCKSMYCHGTTSTGGNLGYFYARSCARSGCHGSVPNSTGCD
jgi:hypothetical protein